MVTGENSHIVVDAVFCILTVPIPTVDTPHIHGHQSRARLIQMSARSKVAALIICLLAAAGAGYRFVHAPRTDQAQAPSVAARESGRLVNVNVAEAKTGQVHDALEMTGVLKPKEQVDISSKVTGRLLQVSGEIGDLVRKGQVVAEVESTELAEQVRRSEAASAIVKATLQQRQAELASSHADLNRAKQLFEAGLIAAQDYDAKRTAYQVLQAQLAVARAQGDQAAAELRELRIRMDQMRITSPIAGYIAQKFLLTGAVVSPATPVLRVVNISTLIAQANVPEGQIAKLRIGTRATVHIDALGDFALQGTVARIGPVLDAATRTALVDIEVPNRNGMLRAEMFARVTPS